jgi:hypothetical protein
MLEKLGALLNNLWPLHLPQVIEYYASPQPATCPACNDKFAVRKAWEPPYSTGGLMRNAEKISASQIHHSSIVKGAGASRRGDRRFSIHQVFQYHTQLSSRCPTSVFPDSLGIR